MSFVTFEEIMEAIAREHAGVIVRNCAPKSVEEAVRQIFGRRKK